MDLLRYHLLGREFTSSEEVVTIHTDEDIDYIIQAVKDSVAELREGGLLPALSLIRQTQEWRWVIVSNGQNRALMVNKPLVFSHDQKQILKFIFISM